MAIEIKVLTGEPRQMAELQRVLEGAPDYALRITGHPPGAADAQSTYTILAPGKGYEDKFVLGIYSAGEMIGCADVFRGYPDRRTAMLGLLLLSEPNQRRGLGKAAYAWIEEFVRNWGGIEKIRIGVVATNAQVMEFWKKMGFIETGERKPFRYDKLVSENIVCEKPIVSKKSRYTMRAVLEKAPLEELWPARHVTAADAELMGVLMDRAYRGTIDDEGETPEQYLAETRAAMAGKYGPYVPQASFWIERDGRPISATLVTMWKDRPLLAFSVTDPAHQGKGLARFLIRKTMNAMADLGYSKIELGVTRGNAAAEHLYRKLGFEPCD